MKQTQPTQPEKTTTPPNSSSSSEELQLRVKTNIKSGDSFRSEEVRAGATKKVTRSLHIAFFEQAARIKNATSVWGSLPNSTVPDGKNQKPVPFSIKVTGFWR